MVLWRLQKDETILTALMTQTSDGAELVIFHGARTLTSRSSPDPSDLFQEAEARRRKLQAEGWRPLADES